MKLRSRSSNDISFEQINGREASVPQKRDMIMRCQWKVCDAPNEWPGRLMRCAFLRVANVGILVNKQHGSLMALLFQCNIN